MADNNIDVFLSYSSENKNVADAIVSEFEAHNIKCWYAPRDIMPGEEWVTAIANALENCKILVLVYTDESNSSRQVMNEVAMAFNAGKTIVPFRLTENKMSSEFEYYLTRVHWLDAVTPPLMEKIESLRDYIEIILCGVDTSNLSRNAVEKKKPEKTNVKKKGKKKFVLPAIIIGAVLAVAALFVIVAASVAIIIGIGGSGKRNLEKGITFYYSEYQGTKDNEAARGYFEKAAKKGEADAYYYLGMLDERNYDYESAKENFEKGIEKGSDLSRLELGNLYENGLGVYPDLVKAISLYDEAMAKGCAEAYCYEGNFYISGYLNYVDESDDAYEYLKKSTDSEINDVASGAYLDLAYMYYNGVYGPEKDVEEALLCYEKAMELNPGLTGVCYDYMAEIKMYEDDPVGSQMYFEKALDYFETSADKGNLDSIFWTGFYYQYGYGTETDYEKAMDYYRTATDRNIPDAYCCIGYLYEYGNGNVKQDYNKAFEWFKKAADMGYAEAMKAIGDMYKKGEYGQKADGTEDFNSARTWYEKAIESGYLPAYNTLASMYEYGLGADDDYDKAYSLYYTNAEFGNSEAMYEIGKMYYNGFIPEDDENDAISWYYMAAKHENTDAMNAIGTVFEENENYEKAGEWYKAAAARNDFEGMRNLGWLYYYGNVNGTPEYENAFKWFKKAADAGDWISEILVATMTADGIGTAENRGEAKDQLEKIVAEGYADASVYYILGTIYYDNIEVPRDLSKALDYFGLAADMGNDLACEKLGDMYYYGDGVSQDISNAKYYYIKAADSGNASGHVYQQLGDMYFDGYGVTINSDTAKTYYLLAENKGLEDADMYAHLGMIYYWEGLYSTSAVYFEKASNLSLDPEQMYNTGCMYYNMSDWQNALIWYGKALENDFDRSEALKQDIRNMVNDGLITEEDAAPYLN
ncbi:MAG: toll/interleukin-1 receptor domain-containing protein [Lachnospiraceae bacterium]|nr:toll/interleukin-1 receptor domain-containing protein [Lachnospiraceae bacterium]